MEEDAQNNWITVARSVFFAHIKKKTFTMSSVSTNNKITNHDSVGAVENNEITAEGVKRLKKFVRAVGTITTVGCRIDPAHLQGLSELEIECIDNLMREDKNDTLFGIKSIVEKDVKCKSV